jgi:hypothetical protein
MIKWHTGPGAYGKERGEVELCCQGEERYLVRFPHAVTQNGKLVRKVLEVVRSSDGGQSWKPVPLRLAIGSRLRFALPVIHREDRWPPWRMDACGVEDGHVVVKLQDTWVMFDLPYPDSSSNREAEWKATYYPDKRHWKLTRLRVLP